MKNIIRFTFIGLVLISAACTPKTVEKVTEVEKPKVETPKETLADNPCTTLNDLSGAAKEEAETAYVLYRDYIKSKEYDTALTLWKKAYYAAPAANGRIKYQFDDGIKIYKYMYEQTTDNTLKQTYYDTIMAIYDKRAECYPDPGYVEGRKAFDNYYYYTAQAKPGEAYELFKKALDAKGKKADYFVINPMTGMISEKLINEEISIEEGKKYVNILLEAIEYGNANCGTKCQAWEVINSYAPARLENLEGIKGLYDCNYYEKKYLPLLNASPTDCEVIGKVYGRLLWGECSPESAAIAQAKTAKETHCYTPPPPPGPLRQAFDAYEQGQYVESVKLFEDFVNLTDDVEKKAKYTLLIAKIYYGDLKKFSKARKYALDAAKHKANWGEPYLLIGKLYASSGPLCGPGTGFDSQIVTWPAIDKFEYAKKIDPATAAEANKLITSYKQYMPTKEDIFFRGLKVGATFTVPCWIQEKTVIRTVD